MALALIHAALGHLVGDFLLQTRWMALKKRRRWIEGWLACTAHVTVYTAVVCLFLGTADPIVWGLVFLPHWIIDRYGLADRWLELMGSRTLKSTGRIVRGAISDKGEALDADEHFNIVFVALVYTVADATLHLLSLWALVRFYPGLA